MKQRKKGRYILEILLIILLTIISIVVFARSVGAENTGGTVEQREDEKTVVKMTASLSRGKDSNNQVNIDTLAEELNRYAGNGTTTVTEKDGDNNTLVVTFKATGNEYEINVNTGEMFNATDIYLEELPSTEYTTPYLPTGFYGIAGTDLDTGLVVQDSSKNQYVWIEVPKNTTVYSSSTLSLDLDSLSGEELTTAYDNIESDLHTYTSTYRLSTVSDVYYSDATTGLTSAEYTTLKQTMLKSVFENGGFYIGRYETGIKDSYRTGQGDTTETAVIQANAYPYNMVTCSQAQAKASEMESGEYTSSLMFDVQWNLVLKYLETKGTTVNELRSDSTSWGNYLTSLWNITNTSAKYMATGVTWASGAYGEKTASTSILLSTGASDTFSKQEIYDLAGNLCEYTLAYYSKESYPCTLRGGCYSGSISANARQYAGTSSYAGGVFGHGFRVALY